MRRFPYLLPVLVLLASCVRGGLGYDLPPDDALQTLSAPVTYQTGTLFVRVSDYLGPGTGTARVESSSRHITPRIGADGDLVEIAIADKRPYSATLSIRRGDKRHDLPLLRVDRYDTRILADSLPRGVTCLIGDMNGWNPYMYPEFTPAPVGGQDLTISAAEGHYRAAFWQPDGTRFVSGQWPVVYNADSVPSNVIYCGPARFSVPALLLDRQEGRSFRIRAENEVDRVTAYWNNHLLPKRLCRTRGGEVSVTLPAEADSAEGFLRVMATNRLGHSNDLLIPVRNGKAALPPRPAPYRLTDSLLYLGTNSPVLISLLTATALNRHGHHRLATGRIPSDTACAEYAWRLTGPAAPSVTYGTSTLERLRDRSLALQYGDFIEWEIQDTCWIYERRFMRESVVVLLNPASDTLRSRLPEETPGTYRTLYGVPVAKGQPIKVAPRSYAAFVSGLP